MRGAALDQPWGEGWGAGQPSAEVACQPAEIGTAGPVADVAVGAYQVLRGVLGAEAKAAQCLTGRVVQRARCIQRAELVHGDSAGVAVAELCHGWCGPPIRRSAEQEVPSGGGHDPV